MPDMVHIRNKVHNKFEAIAIAHNFTTYRKPLSPL